MTDIASVVSQVSANIHSLSNACREDARNKPAFAKRCGLKSIAETGSFSAMVAVHDNLPNMVVKVVPLYDKYLNWAEEMSAGSMVSKMWPKVHSITYLEDHAVVIVDRVEHSIDFRYIANADPELQGKLREARTVMHICDHHGWQCREGEVLTYSRSGDLEILHFLQDVKMLCEKYNAKPDFHDQNFMMDAEGRCICIDPIWSHDRGEDTEVSEWLEETTCY